MIYVCAGMYRSGSTWLYNAVRLILRDAKVPDLEAGWITDKEKLLNHKNSVIKTHNFEPDLANRKALVLTSHRDLRDIAGSLVRKFKSELPIKQLHETVESHAQWAPIAVYDLRYEDLLTDKPAQLRNLAQALQLPAATRAQLSYESISEAIDKEQFAEGRATSQRYDPVNLLHEGHITDGRHGSWKDTLPPQVVTTIEQEFGPWLAARNYI
ncbi:MAG TPA: hypothetical protein VGN61_04615 [Verrucomicrobiae bacterium]|jgi:hypothetical protein